ncbi:MAG: hypothetical protein M1837_002225 [Sclerophora amabilis]|nr:MAG: hypothetical protein M1837_002225 [Sclerophora amabilis]
MDETTQADEASEKDLSDSATRSFAGKEHAVGAGSDSQSISAEQSIGGNGQEIDEFGLPVKRFQDRTTVIEARASDEEGNQSAGTDDERGPERGSPPDTNGTYQQPEPTGLSGGTAQEVSGSGSDTAAQTKERMVAANGSSPQQQSHAETPMASEEEKTLPDDDADNHTAPGTAPSGRRESQKMVLPEHLDADLPVGGASEWSHQQLVPQKDDGGVEKNEVDEWQAMPAFAQYDLYDDDGRLIAREAQDSDEEEAAYGGLGGAGKGYTKVNLDEDARSTTSMDENTQYLFKEAGTELVDEDEDARDPLAQMQATKDLLTEGQRIAYVGVTRVAMVEMIKEVEDFESTKATKKELRIAGESMKMWSQKIMIRLYAHMDIDAAEQLMIEQLSEHGVQAEDLTPALMRNSRVKNPMSRKDGQSPSPRPSQDTKSFESDRSSRHSVPSPQTSTEDLPPPPPYDEGGQHEMPEVRTPSQLPTTKNIDIDLRWTVLCDLFLVLIADSIYDSRSRRLLERVGSFLDVPWLEICKFEKRVTDALEMQEAASKENWNEDEHMENRRKMAVKRRMMMMGLATVGGSLVIGLSAGLLAPVIGAGLAAGFTTIGVAGTSGFLAGAGGAAVITTTGVLTGGTIAVRASSRRMGSVKTFEYRPLHNNKRVNLIVTVSGWMNGKVDDVRLPFSTVEPVMGDLYSVLWEPEMLQSMGSTINILATEALTQSVQQVLGSTVLVALMASLQLPIVLTKLSYLIDNPWTVSLDRANAAGLILADSLIERNLGVRPVTLVGFSLGARVIFACLKELARKGAFGLVQNVYLFGAPIVAKKDEYLRARAVISGRFVSGYATNDWILGYLFRATSGGIMQVTGLAPVEGVPGLENVNVTSLVNGHMAYRAAMPRLLREVGWLVESDNFAEIEDPDPNNHQVRQREIIAEIDEARKELEKEPKKRKFGFFGRNRKLAEKKEWETYDDVQKPAEGDAEAEKRRESNILFDIDAIRAELASEQIEVKQLESTLPPMKLDLSTPSKTPERTSRYENLRSTKSFDAQTAVRPKFSSYSSSPLIVHDTMQNPQLGAVGDSRALPSSTSNESDIKADRAGSLHYKSGQTPSPLSSSHSYRETEHQELGRSSQPSYPDSPLARPANSPHPEYNAWQDEEDDFGTEKQVTMSFE